jgi:hypothetical protein
VTFSRVREVGTTPNVFQTTSQENTPSRPQDIVESREQRQTSPDGSKKNPLPPEFQPKGDSLDEINPFITYSDEGKVRTNENVAGTRLNILL